MSPRVVSTVCLILLLACSLASAQNFRHPTRFKHPCCVKVTITDISREVIGNKYQRPSAKSPCVKAIILTTADGSVCADPERPWVKQLIANMMEE